MKKRVTREPIGHQDINLCVSPASLSTVQNDGDREKETPLNIKVALAQGVDTISA